MLRLVSNVRPEVAADDAVPRGLVLLVELLLDERGNVLYRHKTSSSTGVKTTQSDRGVSQNKPGERGN